jgi:hypothetical protein
MRKISSSYQTWTDKLKVGDLLYCVADSKPAIILGKEQMDRPKYGKRDKNNKRYRFKLYCDGEQGWLDEIRLRAKYKIP